MMLTFLIIILCVASLLMMNFDPHIIWTITFIITLIYLIIKGLAFVGFDLGDIFD